MFRLIDAYRAVKQCHFVLYSTGYALAKLELHPHFHVKVDETESSGFSSFLQFTAGLQQMPEG